MSKTELKTFKITAVIPTVQYGNIQPEYHIEAASFEEAEKAALPYIEKLWARYCAKGSELAIRNIETTAKVEREKLVSKLTGGSALFDPISHTYVNEKGELFESGSKFAKKYQKPFDRENILPAMEEKYGVPADQIEAMWNLKGQVSLDLGNALHGALELYGKFKDLGEVTGANKKPAVNSALHDHPILEKAVTEFFKGREKEAALYEEPVIDEEGLRCGRLDRVLIVNTKKKICRVQDFKSNADINKPNQPKWLLRPFGDMENTPLNGYWLQLSFYSDILKKAGWTVEGMDIFAWNGTWTTYSEKPINFEEVL